ncbi:hypothetical protein MHI11_09240 [Bacillus sp. FSL K6-3312]|uniref:hypothetical protein n=1 Tax=Bacillus sp. FSL K6-3312 TaxID=2921499 RepID=UPI0030FBB064
MSWIEKQTDEYESFWHITTRNNVESILKNGLKQSVAGENSEGVYGIKANSFEQTQLHNVINFMELNGFTREDLVIVEFEHLGSYYINDIGKIYLEDGWVTIRKDIPVHLIDKIIELNEI